jgi:prepilin-type N-terminal cleavage/methylation domain-containing protein
MLTQRALSLIELLVVILIPGILMAVPLATFLSQQT